MLGGKLIHVSKRCPWSIFNLQYIPWNTHNVLLLCLLLQLFITHFIPLHIFLTFSIHLYFSAGIILCVRPANQRWRYIVTSSLIGWAHPQNDPYFRVSELALMEQWMLRCQWSNFQGLRVKTDLHQITPKETKGQTVCIVQCHYNVVNFLPNPHSKHPIAHHSGWDTIYILWVQILIDVLLSSQCCE